MPTTPGHSPARPVSSENEYSTWDRTHRVVDPETPQQPGQWQTHGPTAEERTAQINTTASTLDVQIFAMNHADMERVYDELYTQYLAIKKQREAAHERFLRLKQAPPSAISGVTFALDKSAEATLGLEQDLRVVENHLAVLLHGMQATVHSMHDCDAAGAARLRNAAKTSHEVAM